MDAAITSATGSESVVVSEGTIEVESRTPGGSISLSVPLTSDGVFSGKNSKIELGFTEDGKKKIDFRLQSGRGENQKSLLAVSAPLQVTKLQYSSDERIKQEIADEDQETILMRINKIKVRSYKYTDEWKHVRGDVSNFRVRGVIAQELAEVFPEHVTTIPEYRLDDKDFSMKDFHQVDKTSMIIDLIAQDLREGWALLV